jgi:GT2 family glycosyltransferase
MKLTIVIVNYNVKYFLEQCLRSVVHGIENVAAEVYVVDNASKDGSVELVRESFPWVKLIANTQNMGFSVANNQAMELAKGEYVLLLNPDTIVAEDTFVKCIAFMDAHPEAGALGLHMVDGRGIFLPESKRGLPTPLVAFCKTFGLSAIWPKSEIFGRYHLGYLPEKATNEVEILSGAYMFMRKKALDEVGLLDETFFMYGEDIDLSYRLVKGGYKNYYFADTSIIHYKGESTKKGSLNYVKVFYNAMIIFARKHFSGNQSGLFSLLINFAIVFRGALTLLASVLSSSFLFIIDALLGFGGIYFIKTYWENMIKYTDHYYPNQFLFIVVPFYLLTWIMATFMSGGYDKPFKVGNILRGMFLGTLAIAVCYAFIPDEWRFSRAMILLGAVWTTVAMVGVRIIYQWIKHQSWENEADENRTCIVVGDEFETRRAELLLRQLGYTKTAVAEPNIEHIFKQAAIHQAKELIFCAKTVSYQNIIAALVQGGPRFYYKILNPNSTALIGSNSKDTAGDLYIAEKQYALFRPENLRKKRMLDLMFCIAMFPNLFILVWIQQGKNKLIQNWMQVLLGRKTWVGFRSASLLKQFPSARPAVLSADCMVREFSLSESEQTTVALNYAKHYRVIDDVKIIFKNFTRLGT